METKSESNGIPPELAERIREYLWRHVIAAPEMRIWLRYDESSPNRVEFAQSAVHPISAGAVTEAKQLIEDLHGI